MRAAEVGRELLYPLRNREIVYATVFFWFLFGLAWLAKLFGIALMFLTLPASMRYLLTLLDARANGQRPPVPAIEMFNPADSLWTLTPFIHVAFGTWLAIVLQMTQVTIAGTLVRMAMLAILPASVAVLAMTHSPFASLNPLTLSRMMRACGIAYVIVPLTLIAISEALLILFRSGVPFFLVSLGLSYALVLLFSMTGAVLHARDIARQVAIEEPLEAGPEELARDLESQRQKVANHAYGFISRGNREGGFAHIRQWLDKEAAVDEAWQWFFREMLRWEDTDPALFFAQDYLARLLEWHRESEAIKLIARCLHENESWRPAGSDNARVIELLGRQGRDDLLAQLKIPS